MSTNWEYFLCFSLAISLEKYISAGSSLSLVIKLDVMWLTGSWRLYWESKTLSMPASHTSREAFRGVFISTAMLPMSKKTCDVKRYRLIDNDNIEAMCYPESSRVAIRPGQSQMYKPVSANPRIRSNSSNITGVIANLLSAPTSATFSGSESLRVFRIHRGENIVLQRHRKVITVRFIFIVLKHLDNY